MDERVKQVIHEKTQEVKSQEIEYRDRILVESGLGKMRYLDEMTTEQKGKLDESRIHTVWDNHYLENRRYIVDSPVISDEEFSIIEKLVNKKKNDTQDDKSEQIYNALWAWSKNIKTWGIVLVILFLATGLIFSILTNQPIEFDQELAFYNEIETSSKFNWIGFLSSYSWCMFGAAITGTVCNTLSLLVGALASIVESTRKTAKNTSNLK